MRIRDNQSFLSLYFEPGAVETATGTEDPHTDAANWKRETRSLGQVPTPPQVAKLMARWVMSANPSAVLDPAAGIGSLLQECHRLNQLTKLVGVERDHETLRQAKSAAPKGTKLILADYLLSDAGQFPGIIANPPYVKAHRIEYSEGTWRTFEERFGTPLDRLTNLYALFLLKIWEDLAPRGRAAVIVPAEFLNANFGLEIKQRLLKALRPPGMVIFNPALNLFDESLTTSAIIFLEKARQKTAPCSVAKADSLAEAEVFLQTLISTSHAARIPEPFDLDDFQPAQKWLNKLLNGLAAETGLAMAQVVGDYFDCRRGIATGANDFFCLTKSGLAEHGLGLSHVDPCVAKATDATGLVFTDEKLARLVASDRRCFLLNPRQDGPALAAYLKLGEQAGIPQRHLPSHRPTWYLPENRAVADIWAAVFSREAVKFILNTSAAKNLTCFHGLYAKPGQQNVAPLLTLYLNSSWGRHAFKQVNRFYGDGLNKLEPKDVEALPCPEFPRVSARQSEELVARMAELEKMEQKRRAKEIDTLVSQWTGIPSNADSSCTSH